MGEDAWASVAGEFVDSAYVSVKGQVRTRVIHRQLVEQLPAPPAQVLDVGGGAGHQSIPLARAGYEVTLLDSSAAMLERAEQSLSGETPQVRRRIRLVEASGEDAADAVDGRRFAAVLCHGVVMYLERPEPLLASLAECTEPGGLVSVMALNARTLAVRPALDGRWADALAAFDAGGERGVLGFDTRADTVDGLTGLLRGLRVDPLAWYGVWLFSDWVDLGRATAEEVAAVAAVELEAGRRDPYRQLSRVFHLLGRKRGSRDRVTMSSTPIDGR